MSTEIWWSLDLIIFRLKNESYFVIGQTYRQTQFRDTIQTRAYSFEALVGNIGGYAGLFIGYALAQFPTSVASLFNYLRKLVQRTRSRDLDSVIDFP